MDRVGSSCSCSQSCGFCFFFFSSRRRHTRYWRDWSSDVCSSDLAMVVPGSQQVKAQAEAEGLDEVFRAAGFDWRGAGCSMCLGMNPDTLAPGDRKSVV